jgi:hypothetical protein
MLKHVTCITQARQAAALGEIGWMRGRFACKAGAIISSVPTSSRRVSRVTYEAETQAL